MWRASGGRASGLAASRSRRAMTQPAPPGRWALRTRPGWRQRGRDGEGQQLRRAQTGAAAASAARPITSRARRRMAQPLCGHGYFEVLDDGLEEAFGGQPGLFGADEQREVLGHLAAFDGFDADPFERFGEFDNFGVLSAPAIAQPAGPGKDAGDGVGAGRLPLLVLAIVAGDGAVGGLGLDRLAIGVISTGSSGQGCRSPARPGVRLDVAVVILAGPDEFARPLERRGDHVVDQAVFVDDAGGGELVLEAFLLVDFLEGS